MKGISVLGFPYDYGQDHEGVRKAFSYLKASGLFSRLSQIAPIDIEAHFSFPLKSHETPREGIKNSRFASEGNSFISSHIESMKIDDQFLLNIGGDHGMGLGSIHGILSHRPDTIVIWADAHGDINTPESSPSGNFHGMPLSFLLGLSSHPDFLWIKQKLLPRKLIFLVLANLTKRSRTSFKRLGFSIILLKK